MIWLHQDVGIILTFCYVKQYESVILLAKKIFKNLYNNKVGLLHFYCMSTASSPPPLPPILEGKYDSHVIINRVQN
jgi:hypothetical protein